MAVKIQLNLSHIGDFNLSLYLELKAFTVLCQDGNVLTLNQQNPQQTEYYNFTPSYIYITVSFLLNTYNYHVGGL